MYKIEQILMRALSATGSSVIEYRLEFMKYVFFSSSDETRTEIWIFLFLRGYYNILVRTWVISLLQIHFFLCLCSTPRPPFSVAQRWRF